MHPPTPKPCVASPRSLLSSLILLTLSLARGGGLPVASAFSVPIPSSPTSSATATATMAAATTTVGPSVLRDLVRGATVSSQKESLDLNGIVWLEHLNLVVGDMDSAKKFYVDLLGLSRDANPKHFNLGQQQFHLAANEDPPQRVTGSIGLTVPSLQRIRERVEDAKAELRGTSFSVVADDEDATMTITCPWGNTFHLYDISLDDRHPAHDAFGESSQKMVKMHAEGGAYGPHRMSVRGNPGIRYVEVACRTGTVDSIAGFYEKMLGCQVVRTSVVASVGIEQTSDLGGEAEAKAEAEAAIVCVGPGVHVAFVESRRLTDDAVERMEGVHACFYIPNFRGTYDALKDRNLIWTNPRFTYLDSCDTWEEACASRTLRFKDIVDMTTGEKVLEFEHETRPMLHGQYMKVPPYTPN